jgi:hypothetical protein
MSSSDIRDRIADDMELTYRVEEVKGLYYGPWTHGFLRGAFGADPRAAPCRVLQN